MFILIGCKSSKTNVPYREIETEQGKVLEFANSKCVIFDSLFVAENFEERGTFTPRVSTILYINRKLKKEYYKYSKENHLYNLIKTKDEYLQNDFKEKLKLAKYTQENFDKIDKQYYPIIDSLGRKVILVNFVYASENYTGKVLQSFPIGLYEVRINAKDSSFIRYH
jgi:hypothetical protein